MGKTLKSIYHNCLASHLDELKFFLLNFGIRLFFLYWNTAEYTDGISYMKYSFLSDTLYNPPYPYLIKLFSFFGPGLQTSGRLVSMLAASLCVFPLSHIAKTLYNKRAAAYSCLFFTFSPIIFSNSIRVMCDSTHLFFFLLSFYYGLMSFLHYRKKDIFLFALLTGFATLVRPQTLLFAPLLAILFFTHCRRFGIKKTAYLFGASSISWYIFILLTLIKAWVVRSTGYFGSYKYALMTLTKTQFFSFFIAYIKVLPFVSIYPVFVLFLFSVGIAIKQKSTEKRLKLGLQFSFYVLSVLLLFLPTNPGWSPRYLIPGIPLLLIVAGNGLTQLEIIFRKRWFTLSVVIFCVLCGVAQTVGTILAEKDFFGDIRRAAEYIRGNLKQIPVYSDEILKTAFWSQGEIRTYDRRNLRPSQYIALHSYYTDIERETGFLRQRYAIDSLYESRAYVLPLFNLLHIAPQRTDYTTSFIPKGPEYISVVLYLQSVRK